MDREKAINCLTDIENIMIARQDICPREELQYWIELQEGVADALALLKEQKVQEELKLKIWNSLYTKEDEYEKKLIEADKCHEWFSIYRPWLQMGFNIAIDAIAEWEGR